MGVMEMSRGQVWELRIDNLDTKIEKHDGVYVGYCDELGTVTQGDSLEEVRENLKDAISVHLSVLDELGERERVFREKGIVMLSSPASQICRILEVAYFTGQAHGKGDRTCTETHQIIGFDC